MTNQRRGAGRQRRSPHTFTTHSGNTIKVNRSFSDKRQENKQQRAMKKAAYLATLPKNRFLRVIYRLKPKHVAEFWFSREGALMALKLLGIGIIVVFLLTIGVFAYFRKDLPALDDISGDKLGGSITYYDRTGTTVLWQDYDAVKRTPVTQDQMSPYIREATVAVEDKDFYNEGAFNTRGIVRAGVHDVFGGGGSVQGGSTITQQLVKLNEQWTNNRTITRKVKELILAVELEREYSKADILTGYLNVAPYGGVEYGVQSAAEDYFGISASQLSLAQASMLAAIPKSPTLYSPYSSPQYNSAVTSNEFGQTALIARQDYILDLMATQGMISKAQAAAAKQVNVLSEVKPLEDKYQDIQAPYFVLAAKQQLEDKYGADTVQRGGWKVTTTLNMQLQTLAESLVAKNLPNVTHYGGDEEAMAAENVQTGQMMALVGGVNFQDPDHGQINYAQINISPGSSFKPYDYSTLINNNTDVGAGSVLYDVQEPLPGYPCTNKAKPLDGGNCLEDYDFNYPGPESIRYALAGSRNVPAIKAMLEAVPNDTSNSHVASVDKVISTADAMMGDSDAYKCYESGVDVETASKNDESQCYASSAIGDGAYIHLDEHVNGLATLGRLGVEIPQTYILKIDDASNKTIYQWTQPKGTQVIKQDTAYIVDNMLSDPRASYLTTAYKFQNWEGWDNAVKTGTTNNNYDGLMTSWNTQYAVASWVGYHTRNQALVAGHMEYLTEPLTKGWMEGALTDLNIKPVNWVKPSDIKTLPAYVQRTHVGDGSIEPGPTDEIFPSWYVGKSGAAAEVLDKVSGDLATSCTPADAKETVNGANDNTFSIDDFYPIGKTAASAATATAVTAPDTIHNCGDTPPSVYVMVTDSADANTTGNGTATCTDSCTITVTPTAGTNVSGQTIPLSSAQFPGTVIITANGTQVGSYSVSSSGVPVKLNYTPTVSGSITFSATVTDSELYQGTATATVTATASPNSTTNNDTTAPTTTPTTN
jgi:membrane peptidoglycan carboxypeptidase